MRQDGSPSRQSCASSRGSFCSSVRVRLNQGQLSAAKDVGEGERYRRPVDWSINSLPDLPRFRDRMKVYPRGLTNFGGHGVRHGLVLVVIAVLPIAAVMFAGAFGMLEQLGKGGLSTLDKSSRPRSRRP